MAAEKVLAGLNSSPHGLTPEEAVRRLASHGPNSLAEAPPPRLLDIVLRQFKSLLVGILVAAALVSGLLGEWVDAGAILAIVLLNAVIGAMQEFNAEKSLAALKRMTAPRARVRRGGRSMMIPAAELVPGDILELEAGDRVGADVRLIEAARLLVVEAALTGESEAVEKKVPALVETEVPLGDRSPMAYMGTAVADGSGAGVVVATGMRTQLGGIAALLTEADKVETPLQKRLQDLGKILVWASLGIVALVFVLGLWRGLPFLELLLTSISLAVAAVPEGLPAVVTLALAVGVQRMARRKALIRRLAAVETLGSANVICTDKTGTLTLGEMTVRCVEVDGKTLDVTGEGYAPEGQIGDGGDASPTLTCLLEIFALCNSASLQHTKGSWKVIGDPTEGALLALAAKGGVQKSDLDSRQPKVREHPFDSERKRMSVVHKAPDGKLRVLAKGAPDALLARCNRIMEQGRIRPLEEDDRRRLLEGVERMGDQALRTLAGAFRDTPTSDLMADEAESNLVFVGVAGLQDPPRSEAKKAIDLCHQAGIRVVMITGDHPRTGLAIARELGVAGADQGALSGAELDGLSDEALSEKLPSTPVFARVTASHKLRIVMAWQARGHVVAMTGDGVNDAPALKGADIGIAMGLSGTEVTKEAADMVLADDNFASIVAAVEEGRGIYNNIRKTLLYLLSGNAGELLVMLACVLAGLPTPLLPIHLLWINLVTDGLPALCLATDPIDPDTMRQLPRGRAARFTDGGFLGRMLITGALTGAVTLGVFIHALEHDSLEAARAQAFATLVLAELFRAFGCRSDTRPLWRVSLASNLKLFMVVFLSISFQIWSHHNTVLGHFFSTPPMEWADCRNLILIALIPLGVLELAKLLRHRGNAQQ
ncbi:MAG: cation-translocating P-type ATPase [Planctomycetota bacterium]